MSRRSSLATSEPLAMRVALIGGALVFLSLFLFVPLFTVFAGAFSNGIGAYFDSITTRESLAAIRLTLLTALIVVPLNTCVGLSAAWLISKFRFRGRSFLLTLVDLPFSVSPVIAGLTFVLLLGRRGIFGEWLDANGIQIIFATPGIVLATLFVTFPFVAREVLPLMQAQGNDQEEAALTLGASGWQTFIRVTLPRVRWGLIYGVVLCTARAMGEFGAVSVVSGHVRGLTNTMPLHIEVLYDDHHLSSAFAVASLLTLIALVTLGIKRVIEWRST
jgi:sulfate transport system permease protein